MDDTDDNVNSATGTRGHVNSAFSRVTSHNPTPSIIKQRSVNTPSRWAVTSRNSRATVARQAVNITSRNRRARATTVARKSVNTTLLTAVPIT
jgi:hypothetical protein